MKLKYLAIFGALTLLQACGCEKVVVIPNGLSISPGYIIEADVQQATPGLENTILKVRSIGGVQANKCTITGIIIKNPEFSLARIKNPELICAINENNNVSKSLIGFVVDMQSQYAGLPYKCDDSEKCVITTKDAAFIITKQFSMDGFLFRTLESNETVTFSFSNDI